MQAPPAAHRITKQQTPSACCARYTRCTSSGVTSAALPYCERSPASDVHAAGMPPDVREHQLGKAGGSPAILVAAIPALLVCNQLRGVLEGVGRGLHDGGGQRVCRERVGQQGYGLITKIVATKDQLPPAAVHWCALSIPIPGSVHGKAERTKLLLSAAHSCCTGGGRSGGRRQLAAANLQANLHGTLPT